MTKKPQYNYFIKDEDGKYDKLTEKEFSDYEKKYHKDHDIDCEPDPEIEKVIPVEKLTMEARYCVKIVKEY